MNVKTIMMSAVILLAAANATFGQAVGNPYVVAPTTQAVSGSLVFVKGRIALQSGGATYYIRGIDRLIGFIDGLTEGADAALEGYAFAIPQSNQGAAVEYMFHAVKLTFNGKEYDMNNDARFSQDPRPFLPGYGYAGRHGNMMRRFRGVQPFGRFEPFP
ncbi:MAG: hypothetical protein LBD58_09075 [Treponema sp.]|nr:hypothetical protein [Treponema sp.]